MQDSVSLQTFHCMAYIRHNICTYITEKNPNVFKIPSQAPLLDEIHLDRNACYYLLVTLTYHCKELVFEACKKHIEDCYVTKKVRSHNARYKPSISDTSKPKLTTKYYIREECIPETSKATICITTEQKKIKFKNRSYHNPFIS